MALEEERKFEVGPSFVLPDLSGCLPPAGRLVARPPVTLTATYYDTADLRLARAGVSLRHRRGDDLPWTVKLPCEVPGIRQEISRAGPGSAPPAELVAVVTAFTRGEPVRPVATVQTHRRAYHLCTGDGTVLAEVADDQVSVVDGDQPRAAFREVEVERVAGTSELLDQVASAMRNAGALAGQFTPKHVRALGCDAARPADLVPPTPLAANPRAGDVVTRAIRAAAARVVTHDPLLRLDQPLSGGDTPVHQMRVGCRRLRGDLRTFAALVDRQWARDLRRELRWLARILGAARDIEVMRERLRGTADADPLAPCDRDAVAAIDAELAVHQHRASHAIDEAVTSARYLTLLEALVEATRRPRLTVLASASAREVLPGLVAQPWRRLVDGAAGLHADAPDRKWHAVRVDTKRVRYAVEAVTEVVGDPAAALARRLARLQDLLGEHQDAATAADRWLAIASAVDRGGDSVWADPIPVAVTAGRLYERERVTIRQVRDRFPAVWRAATRPQLVAWLP